MGSKLKRVAMVLPTGEQYSLRLLEGAIRYAEQHPEIYLHEANFKRGHVPKWLADGVECDGWFMWISANESWVKPIMYSGAPLINTCGGWPQKRMSSIGFRTDTTVGAAVDYLAGLKPAVAAIVLYDLDAEPEYRLQRDQFLQFAKRRGLNCAWFDAGRQRGIYESPPRITVHGQERLRAFLRRLPKPAAVWAVDDFMGYNVVETAQAIGLTVPDELAVLGLGDYAVARCCQPHLSTIPQPGDLIGFEAMRVLAGMMANPGQAPQTTALRPPPVLVRGSTHAVVTTDNKMRHAHDFILEHACRGMTAEDLLKIVRMSMPTLIKQFTAMFGRPPGAEIRRIKLEKAQYYLRTTSLSVTQVANLCGFNEYVNFANFFKRETGMTPSDYRAQIALPSR